MSFSTELNNAKLMQKHLGNIDSLVKTQIYLKDYLEHNDEMLQKEKQYADEYINFLMPRFKKWILVVTLIIISVIFFLIFAGNGFVSESPVEMFKKASVIFKEEPLKFSVARYVSYILYSIAVLLSPLCILGSLYCILFLIFLPFRYLHILREKKKTAAYLNRKKNGMPLRDAESMYSQIPVLIEKIETEAEKLFDFCGVNESLRNRENIAYIIELLKINEKKDPTIRIISDYIIKNNLAKESFDRQSWAEVLLYMDKRYTWYSGENPWMIKPLRRKAIRIKIIKAIFLWPWYLLKFQLKTLLAVFNSGGSSESYSPSGYDYRTESVDGTAEPSKKTFIFRDSKGYICESGGLFHDSKGNICEPGGLFYDSRGNICDADSCFYDSKGYFCEPGGAFHDADGNLIYPDR